MAASQRPASVEAIGLAWSLGWRIAAGMLAGYYLDRWLGTSPLLTLTLSLAALAAGVKQATALANRSLGAGGSGDSSSDDPKA